MILIPSSGVLPPKELPSGTNDVHLWSARLDISGDYLRQLETTLSPDECRRAEKFTLDQHRAHFIAGRGFLRSILGYYLQIEPAHILFTYNSYRKPGLDPSTGQDMLHFNLAHSNGVALFAFTRGAEIGVDIEFIRDDTDIEQTGAMVFSPAEISTLRALPPEIRRLAFFQYWTRKEAFIKAVGQGLTLPLRHFDVSGSPENAVANVGDRHEHLGFTNWYVRDVSPLQGYAAAIACAGNDWQVSGFRMPDTHPF